MKKYSSKYYTLVFILVFIVTSMGYSQECFDFEQPNSGVNWHGNTGYNIANLGITTSSGTNQTNHLYFEDRSGSSMAVNNVDFDGNWEQKAVEGCLCFDYRVNWNSNNATNKTGPNFAIYRIDSGQNINQINNSADFGNFALIGNYAGLIAFFTPNPSNPTIPKNQWQKYCLPLAISNNQVPSNSYGTWSVRQTIPGSGNTSSSVVTLTGTAALTAWTSLITNVEGVILAADYHGNPNEQISFDNFCWACTDNPSGSIQLQGNQPDCGPGNICIDYTLPVLSDGSTGAVNLSLNLYQNGGLVNTLSSGTLTSGSEYCFNIDNTLLNSLSGTHFDYVVTGDFNINGISLPSQNIGTPGYGQNTTQNDDYQINCNEAPQLCCDIPGLQVDLRRPRFGSDQLSLVIGGITTPIQEIEVSVADYHFSYGNAACQPADLGVFGNLSSNQNSLNGLNLSGSGTQVMSWKAGSPVVFNGQIPLKISKPNILKLSCCQGTFSVCLKVKVVDVNCNVCEKLVCIELPLEDQTLQQFPGDTKPVEIGNLDPGNGLPVIGPNEVYNPVTGKTWMNKNLGASQVATSPTDALAYGDLYQWGRLTDGHEKRTSGTTTTLSSNDVPGHGNFILHPNFPAPFTWNSPQNINLWQGVNGTNNPCPSGYRIPTDGELAAERLSWTTPDAAGAFASPLKWTVAGNRLYTNGQIGNAGIRGSYWSSYTNGAMSSYMYINSGSSSPSNNYQTADGASVRCIKN